MKRHLSDQGIPMAPFVGGNAKIDTKTIGERLGLPLVRKPRTLSGGRGIEFIEDASYLARTPRRGYLFEGYVDAPEASVESFVNHGEILFENITEYARKQYVNVVPAQLDDRTRRLVLALSRRVLQALRVSWGMAHVEMYLSKDGPIFGEIALRPPGGYIMDLLRLVWDFDPWRAYVATEIDEPFSFPSAPRGHAAAVVVHPGRSGSVALIRGLDDIRAHPAVVDASVRVGAGDRVPPRTGLGVDVGRVLLRASNRDALLEAVGMVEEHLVIEVTAS
jgi:biotin carboxylase